MLLHDPYFKNLDDHHAFFLWATCTLLHIINSFNSIYTAGVTFWPLRQIQMLAQTQITRSTRRVYEKFRTYMYVIYIPSSVTIFWKRRKCVLHYWTVLDWQMIIYTVKSCTFFCQITLFCISVSPFKKTGFKILLYT